MHHHSNLPQQAFSVFIFDKDGTITPPNEPMTEDFSKVFQEFLRNHHSIILTARDFSACEVQILSMIGTGDLLKNCTLACSNGTEIYESVWEQWTWKKTSILPGNIRESDPAIKRALTILREFFERPDIVFEYRSDGMGTFVCIPRSSSSETRKNFDPDKTKRLQAIEKIKNLFPDSYEIIPGGQTSIDLSLMNKKHGLEHIIHHFSLQKTDIVYFGDSFENGNDTPILDLQDITTVAVEDEKTTLRILKNITS